jgi:hypothetical protein
MNTEVIKKLIEYICSRLSSYDQDEVFVAQLVMINGLFDHLEKGRFPDLLADKFFYDEIIQQLTDMGNHINDLYSTCENTNDVRIKGMSEKCNAIKLSIKTIKQKKGKQQALLDEIEAIERQENKSTGEIAGQILKALENHNDACVELFNGHQNKMAVLRESVDALFKMEEDNKEIIAHINENNRIFENFDEAGLIKEGDAQKKTVELETRANELLKEYDGILGNLLEFAKNEKEEISRRQKLAKEAAT